MRYTICPLIVLLLLSFNGWSQQFLTGKILKKGSTEVLESVSIHNLTRQHFELSEETGIYRIQVMPGDRLAFSMVGYVPDTLIITSAILAGDHPVYMEPRMQTLQAVTVGSLSNYQLDSIARRAEYSWIYDHGTTPRFERDRKGSDGVGVSMDLFRKGSSEDKNQDKLKKRLIKEEQQYYVDYRYSREYIARLTHLQGDSLQKFFTQYRPSYDYCRKAATVDILVFISDNIKKFRKGERPN